MKNDLTKNRKVLIMCNDSLLDVLYSKKELVTGMIVGSQLIKELEIYGFIPYIEDTNLDSNIGVPLDMRLGVIASDRVSFSIAEHSLTQGLTQKKGYVILPIYRKIRYDNAEHDLLLENLYVFSFRCNNIYNDFRNRKLSQLQNLTKVSSRISIDNSRDVHYKTKSDEILMYKKRSYPIDKVSGVASYLLIVCRFLNSVTGRISYVIYPPEDLFLLAK